MRSIPTPTQRLAPASFLTAPPSRVGRFLAIVGSVCLGGSWLSLLDGIYTVGRQFSQATGVDTGTDPESVRRAVGAAFHNTELGLGLSLVGFLLAGAAVFGFRFAPAWLRSVLQIGTVPWLPVFPVGTVFALALLAALRRHPQTFASPPSPDANRPGGGLPRSARR